jgi:type II secretory pathway component PulM
MPRADFGTGDAPRSRRAPLDTHSTFDAWRNRPGRERWLIGLPLVALVIVALYIGVIEPMRDASRAMRASLLALESRRATVNSQAAELRGGGSANPKPLSLPAIQSLLFRFQLSALNPTVDSAGANRARLSIARVPFFAIWPMLEALQSEQAVRLLLRIDWLDSATARTGRARRRRKTRRGAQGYPRSPLDDPRWMFLLLAQHVTSKGRNGRAELHRQRKPLGSGDAPSQPAVRKAPRQRSPRAVRL